MLNRLNQALLARDRNSGEAFLSNAVVDGRYLLRMCIVNFRTSLEDIEALPGMISEQGSRTYASMQSERVAGVLARARHGATTLIVLLPMTCQAGFEELV